MKDQRVPMAVLFLLALPALADGQAADTPPRVYGRLEHVHLFNKTPIDLPAVMTGAGSTTTLAASDIKYSSGEGGMWVHFTVDTGEAEPSRKVAVTAFVIHDERIKTYDGIKHRPVVKLDLCLANHSLQPEVEVIEKTAFGPPLSLGHGLVRSLGAVDKDKKFTVEPTCDPPKPPPQAADRQ